MGGAVSQVVDCINNLDALPVMDEGCVDAIVTDPPYGLGFMGKSWDCALPDPRTWAECLRVLKPGGHAVIFGAPRLYHRLAVAVEDAGFEVRDVLMWMFGSGFPKSLDVSKAIDGSLGADRKAVGVRVYGDGHVQRSTETIGYGGCDPSADTRAITAPATPEAAAWAGWGTALKPAYEPILLVRKPLVGTVAQNVLTYGTGGINVDACRVGDESTRRQNTAEMGYHGGNTAASYSTGSDAGRWPANVIMDEEAGAVLDEQTGTLHGHGSRSHAGSAGWFAGAGTTRAVSGGEPGGASRFFYCPKASRSEREAGLKATDGQRANTHPTVKPIALMEWLVCLVTPPGGLVLDPFCGSGSTGVACARLGVRFLGLELDPDYAELARMRIAHARGE